MRDRRSVIHALLLAILCLAGCRRHVPDEIVVYCGVDEPYASQIFSDFEKQTGLHVAPQYDIESSKSVGLTGKLEAEAAHPRADVWWGSEAFLSARLADEGILQAYASPAAADIPSQFRDEKGMWTGVGLRARVLAVGALPPGFEVSGLMDLADPRVKGRIAMSRPTAGATGAHLAALYAAWGPRRAEEFFQRLHDNGIALLGGNAEVADQVGAGIYVLGLTDSDAVSNSIANGAKLTQVAPDQKGEGTVALPTTVGLVKGARHEGNAKKLIDFLESRQGEQKLLDLKYARWSVRGTGADEIKAMKVDYRAAAQMFPRALRDATEILEGRSAQ